MLKETHEGEQITNHGSPSLSNQETIDNINIDLFYACKGYFITPYKPFLATRRILEQYGVNFSSEKYHLGSEGELTIPVAQYNDPSLVKEEYVYYLIFSYVMDENGYEAYAELTNKQGLEEIESFDA